MSELSLLVLVTLPFLALLVGAIVDVVTRRDLRLARRIGWIALLIVLPVVGLAIYVVARPPKTAHRSGGHTDTARAETIVLLAERRQRHEISEEEYRAEVGAIASID